MMKHVRNTVELKENSSKINVIRGKSIRESVETKPFQHLSDLVKSGEEGLVVMGAGGDPQEWIDGILKLLKEEGIAKPDATFGETFLLDGNVMGEEGRTDLVLLFNTPSGFEIGKLAMWRIKFGSASWASDFIVNYAKDYGVSVEDEDEDMEESKVNESIELRQFDDGDWSAWAGAEKPAEGTEPLVAEVKVLNWVEPRLYTDYDGLATLIIDKNGITLNGVNGALRYDTSFEEAKEIVASMSAPIDVKDLDGWEDDGNMEIGGE